MRDRRWAILILASCCLILWSGCSSSDPPPPPAATAAPTAPPPPQAAAPAPFRVLSVDLGRALDASKKVAQPTTTFAPTDTIYASVATAGAAPSVVLGARWTYEDGQLVNEGTQTIAPSGPAVSEFHIARPSGWPAGKYKLEISVDGKVATVREFTVG